MKNYYAKERHNMLAFVPSHVKSFLDVGCANGGFGRAIKESREQSRVWGIEIADSAAEEARSHLDNVLQGDACSLIPLLPDNSFDCVICNDSLEHMADPYAFLEEIKPKLKSTSYIVSSIPNVRHYKVLSGLLFQKDWRYVDSGVLDRTHLRFFTKKSIQRMFKELGYDLEMIEPINKSRKVKVRVWAWLTLGWLKDILPQQYACVVRLEKNLILSVQQTALSKSSKSVSCCRSEG